MYVRIVTMNLKPNHFNDFTQTLEKTALPMLRKQHGFKDMLTLAGTNGSEVRTISVWDTKQNADSYNGSTYPDVIKAFGDIIEGTPQVAQFEVIHSTLHTIPALATV